MNIQKIYKYTSSDESKCFIDQSSRSLNNTFTKKAYKCNKCILLAKESVVGKVKSEEMKNMHSNDKHWYCQNCGVLCHIDEKGNILMSTHIGCYSACYICDSV